MVLKILGSGCPKCNKLEANAKEAMEDLGKEYEIEHVTDIAEIAEYGVMSTPALVIDEKVLFSGKVVNVNELKKILSK